MWNASFKLTLFGCVIYICCVGSASLDVVCDELNEVASGSVDLTILDNSTLWLTVSNAAVRLTATHTVRCGGFLWLKPVAISLVSCSKAEVVECPGRKPCWSADGSRWLLMIGSKRASITFAAGQRSQIGR